MIIHVLVGLVFVDAFWGVQHGSTVSHFQIELLYRCGLHWSLVWAPSFGKEYAPCLN